MNEWELQRRMTKLWAAKGLKFQDELLFLATWELMIGDWGINDARREWHQPSVDFLFCDRRGGLWVMELKVRVTSPRDIYSVLCQVTHRALGLHASFSYDRLSRAFFETRCGNHGRICDPPREEFRWMHRRFFGLRAALPKNRFNTVEPRRIVGATEFSASWFPMARAFSHSEPERLRRRLQSAYETRTRSNLEFRRYCELSKVERASVEEPVLYLNLTDELDRFRRLFGRK